MKKFVFVLSFVIFSNFTATKFLANEDLILGKYTIQEASDLTGFSVSDLKEYKNLVGDLFDGEIQRFIDSADLVKQADSRQKTESIGQYFDIAAETRPGDILITDQSKTAGFVHGHAAMVYDDLANVETYGGLTLSDLLPISNWQNKISEFAALRVTGLSEGQSRVVAEYGKEYLLDWYYAPLASATDPFFVNCSSLVAKAYLNSGYQIVEKPNSTVLPVTLLNSDSTRIIKVKGNPFNFARESVEDNV